jgi:hypothetical protein
MLMLPSAVRVFVYTGPTDMRRSFDGLAAMVREIIGQNPLSGHIFVFVNRLRDRVKLLVWDRSGYLLVYKYFVSQCVLSDGVTGLVVRYRCLGPAAIRHLHSIVYGPWESPAWGVVGPCKSRIGV